MRGRVDIATRLLQQEQWSRLDGRGAIYLVEEAIYTSENASGGVPDEIDRAGEAIGAGGIAAEAVEKSMYTPANAADTGLKPADGVRTRCAQLWKTLLHDRDAI